MNTKIPYRKRCDGQGDVCTPGHFFSNLKARDNVGAYANSLSPVPLQRPGISYVICDDLGTAPCNTCLSPASGVAPAGWSIGAASGCLGQQPYPNLWIPATAVAAGFQLIDANGNLETAQNSGTTGAAQPVWPAPAGSAAWSTVMGNTTTDGGVTWKVSATGLNWLSAFCGGGEEWQAAAQDVEVIQQQAGIFTAGGKTELGACHKYGFKKYAAQKQWHGIYGWTSNDGADFAGVGQWVAGGGNALGDQIFDSNGNLQTVTAVNPYDRLSGADPPVWPTVTGDSVTEMDGATPTKTWTCCAEYHPHNTVAPDQTRYLTMTLSGVSFSLFYGSATPNWTGEASGVISVNPISGEKTSSLLTSDSQIADGGTGAQLLNISSGAGWDTIRYTISGTPTLVRINYASGHLALCDLMFPADLHGLNQINIPAPVLLYTGVTVQNFISAWNGEHDGTHQLPLISNPNNYSATVGISGDAIYCKIVINRTATVYSWDMEVADGYGGANTYAGTLTLSNPYTIGPAATAGTVRHDLEASLLAQWDLNGPEPWRKDSWESIMPMVQRREVQGNVQPWGFNTATKDDLSQPITDANANAPFTSATENPPPPGWTYNAANHGAAIADSAGYPPNSVGWTPTYQSSPALDWVPTYVQTAWFDPASYFWVYPAQQPGAVYPAQQFPAAQSQGAIPARLMMDGAIIGAPVQISGEAAPGANNWFDFYFTDKRFCGCAPAAGCSCLTYPEYTYAYGGTLADASVSLSSALLCDQPGNDNPSYGAFLPANATHWTGNDVAHNMPRGALLDIGTLTTGNLSTTGAVTAVKAAFARLPVPSYNFARPCGSDRVLIDELTAQPFTAGLLMAGPLPALAGQTVLVYGTATSDGIYTGCTQPANLLTLGTKIADIPADYYHPYCGLEPGGGTNNFTAGFAGIVRFPNAWALCGRQAVTPTASGGGALLTFAAAQTNLRTADEVDLYDAEMNLITGSLAVTRASDTAFSVTAAYSGISQAAYACSHSAPPWYWNDAAQKFDFRFGSWNNQNRIGSWPPTTAVVLGELIVDSNGNIQEATTAGVTGSSAPAWPAAPGTVADGTVTWTLTAANWTGGLAQFGGCNPDCLKFSVCDPQVFAFTPNADIEDAWHSQWFGDSGLQDFMADGVFGSRVQGNVEFEQDDLLWQAPLCPLTVPGIVKYTCIEDAGLCTGDTSAPDADNPDQTDYTLYSPPRPRMEARCGPVLAANGAGAARNEPAWAFPPGTPPNDLTATGAWGVTDAVNGVLTWPEMQQPVNPGVIAHRYTVPVEPWMRYADELANGTACRFKNWYYSFNKALGNGT